MSNLHDPQMSCYCAIGLHHRTKPRLRPKVSVGGVPVLHKLNKISITVMYYNHMGPNWKGREGLTLKVKDDTLCNAAHAWHSVNRCSAENCHRTDYYHLRDIHVNHMYM